MYYALVESYVRWLEANGSRGGYARTTAAFTLSGAAFANLLAFAMLIQAAGGPPLLRWFSYHAWIVWPAAVAIAIVHCLLCWKVPPINGRSQRPGRRWWRAYLVATLLVWILAGALTLADMATGSM